jgi:hypothetical protein
MSSQLEYHNLVNRSVLRSIPASLALFGMFLFFSASNSSAQFNSSSGGGHSGSSAPPTSFSSAPHTGSVAPPTGITHNGMASSATSGTRNTNFPHSPGSRNGNPNHHPPRNSNGAVYYAYPYYYGAPVSNGSDATDANAADDDADCQGGPTIFDRCGSGPGSYVPPTYNGPAHPPAAQAAFADPAPDSAPESSTPTTLVFKDGHEIEVANYAIVGQSLYDLTSGHHRKIALADLDIPSTQKQNDDSGTVFQLPPAQAN